MPISEGHGHSGGSGGWRGAKENITRVIRQRLDQNQNLSGHRSKIHAPGHLDGFGLHVDDKSNDKPDAIESLQSHHSRVNTYVL